MFYDLNDLFSDLFPSCEVRLTVHRGTTWKSASQQPVTVRCPVKHCGKSLNVSCCKLLDTNSCERINNTENVEITQTDNYVEDELISYLTFKRISIYDDGLYRWDLKGYEYELISHIINISVSGTQFIFPPSVPKYTWNMSNFKC